MIRIDGIKLPVGHDEKALERKILSSLRLQTMPDGTQIKINRKSLDARKKPELYFVYSVNLYVDEKTENALKKKNRDSKVSFLAEEKYEMPKLGEKALYNRPVVVGSGPAGLFCAYLLSLKGFNPIIIERGESVENRTETVNGFFEGRNDLNPESNVQFGEGGAGTFSDGKLNTLVKDKNGRNGFVLETFVKFGAKEEITYLNKPHLGTDELIKIVKNMRNEIVSLGGEFRFNTKLSDISIENSSLKSITIISDNQEEIIDTDVCILAIGHSARDTFAMLNNHMIEMQQKNFAVGLRIEHKQSVINKSQYGKEQVEGLKAADYKLTYKTDSNRSVYTFCMCPGGYVVNASSEKNRLAVNGMSYSGRNSDNANSAIIVSVGPNDFASDEVMAGIEFQRRLEETAYRLGNGKVPVQKFSDYEDNIKSVSFGDVVPLTKGANNLANLRELFTDEINEAIIEGVHAFGKNIDGFDNPDSILSGVESRTSSPIRIVRDETFNSNVSGLYPCGEGAGYAGGITSAAMDGLKIAERIISLYKRLD